MQEFKYIYYILLADGTTYYVNANNRKQLVKFCQFKFAVIKRTINRAY